MPGPWFNTSWRLWSRRGGSPSRPPPPGTMADVLNRCRRIRSHIAFGLAAALVVAACSPGEATSSTTAATPTGSIILPNRSLDVDPHEIVAFTRDDFTGAGAEIEALTVAADSGTVVTAGDDFRYIAPHMPFGGSDRIAYTVTTPDGGSMTGSFDVSVRGRAPDPAGFDVVIGPQDDAAAVVAASPPATSFLFTAGVHRIDPIRPKEGDRFSGTAGAVLSGARTLDGWQRSASGWFVDGQTQGDGTLTQGEDSGFCAEGKGDGCIFPEMVFREDVPLRRVMTPADLTDDTWLFDYAADRIFVGGDPTNARIETSVAPYAFWGDADDVTIEGLTIEKFATPLRQGAINPRIGRMTSAGRAWTVRGNEIRLNHGYGVKAEDEMTIVGNEVHHNGQMGIGSGSGKSIIVTRNAVYANCAIGVDAKCLGWSGGGMKLDGVENVVITENYVYANSSHGIHVDHFSVGAGIIGNVVVANEGVGIHFEISDRAEIADNLIMGNGVSRGDPGIFILSAGHADVHDNRVVGNGRGLIARQDGRVHHQLEDLWVHNNYFELDGEATVGLTVSSRVEDGGYFTTRNNRFEGNTYILEQGATDFAPFRWMDRRLQPDAWQEAGNDRDGAIVDRRG